MSGNKIQKKLQNSHLGIRRKDLFAEIRRVKHQKTRPYPERHIPRKYRKSFMIPLGKQIAGYGSVHGKPKRIQTRGTGKELYQVMKLAVKHPPKKQFLTVSASKLLANPHKYLDYDESWDEHPEIKS